MEEEKVITPPQGNNVSLHQLIDVFRQAAIGMAPWRDALAGFAELAGGHVGQIIGMDRSRTMIVNLVTGVSPEQVADYLTTGGADPNVNPRTRAALLAAPLRTIGESDFGSYDALRRHPYYRSFLEPQQVPYASLTKLVQDEGRMIVMAVMRSEKQGHLTDDQRALIDRVAPAIRDAVVTGLELERRQLDLLSGTLDGLDSPTFALNSLGQVISLSPGAERMLAEGEHLAIRQGRVVPAVSWLQRDFEEAVARTARDAPAERRFATPFRLPAANGGPMRRCRITPLPQETHGWLTLACCLVTVRSLHDDADDLRPYLEQQYRLTPSECVIVVALLQRDTPRQIAMMRGASEGTVRTQIKSILAKTGFRRQVDLIAHLSA